MTIIEKIKQSVEGATGMPFLYHAAGELNELIARCGELPVAYSFLIDSGTIDDVNGRYHERVTIAVMFCDKTEFDFNASENEQIIDRMKVKAYKWMQSLRMSNALRVVSVNNTQRLYDNTTDILTGFAVNITLEDITGVGDCELPDVVFEIKENGEYPVVGIDKVFVNVLPKSTDIVITENGEYHPNDYDVDAFSKVDVDVKPKLEELTATDNGTYTPSEGFDGFGKVNVDLSGKVKLSTFKITNDCINEEGRWEGDVFIGKVNSLQEFAYNCSELKELNANHWDTSSVTKLTNAFYKCSKLKTLNIKDWDTSNVTKLAGMFENCSALQEIDINNWDVSNVTSIERTFFNCSSIKHLDLSNWDTSKVTNLTYLFYGMNNLEVVDISNFNASSVTSSPLRPFYLWPTNFHSLVGERTIEDVINNNIGVFIGLKYSLTIDNSSISLDRASLRAIINGIAEVETTQTLRLGSLKSKLTEEDIEIATNKNWTIA